MLGLLKENGKATMETAFSEAKDRSNFNCSRYQFFLDAPFEIANHCCNVMKKSPAHSYQKKTGRNPMTAEMATESRLRTQKWLNNGCNGFDLKMPKSTPMAFWTEQDVLWFIKSNNVKIASVYGNIVKDNSFDGQMDLDDFGVDLGFPKLKTTGLSRTGCMYCLYGIHMDKFPNRLERMKVTHPKVYEYLMKPESEGGLGYKEKIDWINEHGNMHIKY